MILITGATGHLGKATIEFLLEKGYAPKQITAFVRDENKAADLKAKGVVIKTGDYNDYTSMVSAFTGAEKVLLISSNDVQNRTQQQIDAITAAKEAGVKHVLYTSIDVKDFNHSALSGEVDIVPSHAKTADHLKASGLHYTLLNNSLYAETLPMFLGENVVETGVFFPSGDGKVPFATRQDMAEAIANILAGSGHENKTYTIAADTLYSLSDVAGILTELSGKQVPNVNPPAEVFASVLTSAGVPEFLVKLSQGFAEAIKQNEFETGRSELEQLLGRKPTTLKDYLKTAYFSNN